MTEHGAFPIDELAHTRPYVASLDTVAASQSVDSSFISFNLPQNNPTNDLLALADQSLAIYSPDLATINPDTQLREPLNNFVVDATRPCELLDSKEKEKAPYAFDLSREYTHAQQFGEEYRPFFEAQLGYYLKETYGHVPEVTYFHSIRDGKLYIDALNQFATESYAGPANDDRLPRWYQERALNDYEVIQKIEKEFLPTAKPGDIFLDMSPAPFDVNIHVRKEWNFGEHSFVRASQVSERHGKKILETRAYRNYLDEQAQQQLFQILTGQQVSKDALMGASAVIDQKLGLESIHNESIQMLIDKLYAQTPPERKIVAKNDEFFANNQEMDTYLEAMKPWIHSIYGLLQNGPPLEQANNEYLVHIESQFHGLENAIQALVEQKMSGKNTSFFAMNGTKTVFDHNRGLDLTKRADFDDFKAFYTQQEYRPESTSCGTGSGFGKGNGGVQDVYAHRQMVSGLMNYDGMSNMFKDLVQAKMENTFGAYQCPKCGAMIPGNSQKYECPACEYSRQQNLEENGVIC